MEKKKKFGWDRGVEFTEMKKKLEKMIDEFSQKDNSQAVIGSFYSFTAYLQLLHGLRAQEALEAALKFTFESRGEREVMVKVRKKKKPETRLVFLPPRISRKFLKGLSRRAEILAIKERFERDSWKAAKSYQNWCRKHLKVNSHALRYSFVVHLSQRGVSPQLIARITAHSRLDYILRYTSQIKAEELLREVVGVG